MATYYGVLWAQLPSLIFSESILLLISSKPWVTNAIRNRKPVNFLACCTSINAVHADMCVYMVLPLAAIALEGSTSDIPSARNLAIKRISLTVGKRRSKRCKGRLKDVREGAGWAV